MTNKLYIYILLILVAVISAGCSRPADSEFGSLRNIQLGNEILGIADRQLDENNIPAAEQSYLKALKEFSLIDHHEGKARAYLGLIRVSTFQDSMNPGWNYFAKIEKLKPALGEELKFLVLAGRIEWFSAFAKYDSVLHLTDNWKGEGNTRGKIVLLTNRLNAFTSKGISAGDDLLRAEAIFDDEYEEDPYRVEVGVKVLSDLSFAIGMQKFILKQVSQSEKYFNASLSYDKLTGKYSGIAENLYMLGLIASGNGSHKAAEDFLVRALGIVEQIGMHSRMEYIRSELAIARIQLGINVSEEKGILQSIQKNTTDSGLREKISGYLK